MKYGIFVAPFGQLADPGRLQELASGAEQHGWDGVYLWDHVLRATPIGIVDPWVSMAAMATVTDRIRLGAMVTPLVRRRPMKLAREVLTLDLLSSGRVTVGLGLGNDNSGELSKFGEIVDPKRRGAMLDEGVRLLADLLEGREVVHDGEYFTIDGVTLRPAAVQRPRPPIWMGITGSSLRPVRRAARFDGVFPIHTAAENFDRVIDAVVRIRGDLDGFDVCVSMQGSEPPAYAQGVATWVVVSWPEIADLDELFDSVSAGPPR